MSSTGYSDLIRQLEQIGEQPPRDETQRRKVATALRRAYAALETPLDVVHRIAYSVRVQCERGLSDQSYLFIDSRFN
jgi:hypothetical protein